VARRVSWLLAVLTYVLPTLHARAALARLDAPDTRSCGLSVLAIAAFIGLEAAVLSALA
jgi:hypothetical protein